jgi:hypothetical protein
MKSKKIVGDAGYEKAGGAANAYPAGSGLLTPLIKTWMRENPYKATIVVLVVSLLATGLTWYQSHPSMLAAIVTQHEKGRFAEITSPIPGSVSQEIRVEGAVRGVKPNDELYLESKTDDNQYFYRRVSADNGRFWYDKFHPGKKDADFGKTFRLRVFIPKPGTLVKGLEA